MHTNEQRNRRMGCSNAGIFTEALPVAEELGDRDRTCGWAVTECTGPRGTQTPQKESCQLVTWLPLNSSQQRSCDPGLGPVPTVEGRIGSLSCSLPGLGLERTQSLRKLMATISNFLNITVCGPMLSLPSVDLQAGVGGGAGTPGQPCREVTAAWDEFSCFKHKVAMVS